MPALRSTLLLWPATDLEGSEGEAYMSITVFVSILMQEGGGGGGVCGRDDGSYISYWRGKPEEGGPGGEEPQSRERSGSFSAGHVLKPYSCSWTELS